MLPLPSVLQNAFSKLGVQSKVLAMVLLASLLSLLLTGLLSYSIGSRELTKAAMNQLVAVRSSRGEAIKDYFDFLSNHAMSLSESFIVVDGLDELRNGYNNLKNTVLNAEQKKKVRAYYDEEFIPKLRKNVDGDPVAATYMPQTNQDAYITFHYTVNNPSPLKRSIVDDAGDSSDYSRAHKKFNGKLRRISELFDYRDILLVDIDTANVIYSVAKEADLGTNLKTGPFSDTALAETFEAVRRSRDPNFIYISDLEHYKPSYGEASFFIGTTVFDGDRLIGALIIQPDPAGIDRVMTDNRKWEMQGMGKTGETLLVGPDHKVRSTPREFIQNPSRYFEIIKRQGVSSEKLAWIRRSGSPVLIQAINTEAANRALAGKTGEVEYIDYRGQPVIGAYQPLQVGRFEWGLLAKIDRQEALQGVGRLRSALLLLGSFLIPLLTMLSLSLARSFIRPIQRLISATKTIAAGQSSVQVQVDSDDEFGELSHSFNAMASTLQQREEAISSQLQENDRLLLNILPARTAERLKQGESSITEHFPSVTVLYAELEGFQDLCEELSPDQAIQVLNELIGAFDDAADRFGVEKLRSAGSNYVAVCGLSMPRVDDEKRTAEFALTMLQVVERLSAKHHVLLSLDIGIHTGELAAGVVGKSRFYYDVWGETMTIARTIHASPKQNVIQVSEPVLRALDGLYHFEALEPIVRKEEAPIPVWELTPLRAGVLAEAIGSEP